MIRPVLLALALALSSCGGGASATPADSNPALATSGPQGESHETQELAFDTSMVQVAELPEGFPASFPIPAGSQVTSSINLPGEGNFRAVIAVLLPMEDALAYYLAELPANDWTIVEQAGTALGAEMTLASGEYNGELVFVGADTGVALDVHLFPIGTGDFTPDLAQSLGDSAGLGAGGGSFPVGFPVPTSFSAVDLNEALRGEGYELAFSYASLAEMAMVELNIALMTAGWEIGEVSLKGANGVYILPFEAPGGGFAGFAYITSSPGRFNLDIGGAVLIALAPGQP